MARVALVYQRMVQESQVLAEQCARMVERRGLEPVLLSNFDIAAEEPCASDRFAVTFGGDGTILRVARWLAGAEVPIIGVQMGRLGFLAELLPVEVPDKLSAYLDGDYWVDRRAMLRAEIVTSPLPNPLPEGQEVPHDAEQPPRSEKERGRGFSALNDIVVGGGHPRRTVTVELSTAGHPLHQFRCDGVIVATPTGSTAYSFASGGPVLAPDTQDVVVTPISPHLSALHALVLPGHIAVRLEVRSAGPAELTVDGQVDHALLSGEAVEARLDTSAILFARRGPPADLYGRIFSKLG